MRFAAGVNAAGPKPSSPESKMLPSASGKAIPVVAEHGSRQPVIVWKMSRPASRLTNCERLAGGDDGRVAARVGEREVALAVEEAADVDLVRPRPVRAARPGSRRAPASPPW